MLCAMPSRFSRVQPFRPMTCSPPGSSVHGTLQARILQWIAVPSSRGSSQPRNRTHISGISCITGRFTEPPGKPGKSAQPSRNLATWSLQTRANLWLLHRRTGLSEPRGGGKLTCTSLFRDFHSKCGLEGKNGQCLRKLQSQEI